MKKVILPALLVACSYLFGQGNSADLIGKGLQKFPIEKGKIEYSITGNAIGKATLFFDRYGWRSALITEMTMKQFGVESKEYSQEIWDGDYWFKIDLNSNKGTMRKDDRWSQLVRYKETSEIPAILYAADGAVNSGPEMLLDRQTVKWTFAKGITQSVNDWNGIPLKTIKKLPGMVYEVTAGSIDENPEIDLNIFDLPEGVSWE